MMKERNEANDFKGMLERKIKGLKARLHQKNYLSDMQESTINALNHQRTAAREREAALERLVAQLESTVGHLRG